jgi:ferredoxin-NADP reductase
MMWTTVAEVRRETANAATLRLDLEGAAFGYRPGQYVTIDPYQFDALAPALRDRETARGKREGPGYFSLSSDATDPRVLEITVRATSTGAPLPPFLVRDVRPGQKLSLEGPAGRYFLPAEPPPDVTGILHLCAGSGVAPNRGMIRHALAKGWPQRHVLVLQERGEEDVLFREEWREMLERHGSKLRIRHVYSSKNEYVSPEILRDAMSGAINAADSLAFLCGPNTRRDGRAGFVETWKTGLRDAVGFSPARIVTEG